MVTPHVMLAGLMIHDGKTQGMCQGNGAALNTWTVMRILMIPTQRRKDHGTHSIASISSQQGHLIGRLFVDNADIFHLKIHMN
jgi:hypothetical protein